MSLKFKNIDSIFDTNNSLREFNIFNYYEVESRLTKIPKDLWDQNIYLVSPELMDIIYPKTKREGIDWEKVEVNIELFHLPKWTKYSDQESIAIGVYCGNFIPSSYSKKLSKFSSENTISIISNISGPSIFICPERIFQCTLFQKRYGLTIETLIGLEIEIKRFEEIFNTKKEIPVFILSKLESKLKRMKNEFESHIDYLKSEQKSFNTLLLKVCLHEIAHYYMSGNYNLYNKHKQKRKRIKVDKVASKLIEESFANVFAWSQFSDPKELKIIESFMDSQPFEYSAYRFWINDNKLKKCVPFLISSWKYKIDPFVPEYLFEHIDEVFSDYYYTDSYERMKNEHLDFHFERHRLDSETIDKIKKEKNFWEAVAKSMIYYLKTNKKTVNLNNP
jgi:hypothetical protein